MLTVPSLSSLPNLELRLRTSNPGVYLILVRRANGTWNWYVGSSFGKYGLQNRVFSNHKSEAYRRAEPGKLLYKRMDEPGARSSFVRLVEFDGPAPKERVLVAETVCMALFKAHHSPFLRALLPDERTWIPSGRGLNRSMPTMEVANIHLGDMCTSFSRQRLFNRCQGIYEWSVSKHSWSYLIYLGACQVVVPVAIAKRLGLHRQPEDERSVWVQFDIADGPHDHQWAEKTSPSDDGARVGIRVFRSQEAVDDEDGEWIRSASESFRGWANAMFDFMTGRMLEKDYVLPEDRKALLRHAPAAPKETEPEGSEPKVPRKIQCPSERPSRRSAYGAIWGEGRAGLPEDAPTEEGPIAEEFEPPAKKAKTASTLEESPALEENPTLGNRPRRPKPSRPPIAPKGQNGWIVDQARLLLGLPRNAWVSEADKAKIRSAFSATSSRPG